MNNIIKISNSTFKIDTDEICVFVDVAFIAAEVITDVCCSFSYLLCEHFVKH